MWLINSKLRVAILKFTFSFAVASVGVGRSDATECKEAPAVYGYGVHA